MTRTARLTIVLLAFTFTAGIASAENGRSDYFNRNGWYLGLNGIYAHGFFEDEIEDAVGGTLDLDGSAGLNVRAGYRVTSWFAAELLYEWVDGFRGDLGSVSDFIDLSTHSVVPNFKLIAPWCRIQPYVGIGLGAQKSHAKLKGFSNDSQWAFLTRPAFGIDWILTDHIVLNTELAGSLAFADIDNIGGSNTNIFALTIGGGVQYRF